MLKIKNWSQHQHFKDRNPPWIKLHKELLDDPEWFELEPKYAKTLLMLWLIASEDKDREGKLPSVKKIAFRLRISEKILADHLTHLNHWVIQDDITVISERYQVDVPETEAEAYKEETETEEKKKYLDTVYLLKDQHQTLVKKYGMHHTTRAIVMLNNYKASSGKKYKSDYHAILSWAMEKAGGRPKEKPVALPPCPECNKHPCECIPLTEAELAFNRERAKGILEALK